MTLSSFCRFMPNEFGEKERYCGCYSEICRHRRLQKAMVKNPTVTGNDRLRENQNNTPKSQYHGVWFMPSQCLTLSRSPFASPVLSILEYRYCLQGLRDTD